MQGEKPPARIAAVTGIRAFMKGVGRPSGKSPRTSERERQILDDALTYIASHAWPGRPDEDPVRVTDVAREVGVSARHLQRILREVGGTTFTEARQAASMARAEHALLEGTTPVAHIAAQAGYAHAGRFAQVFRRHRHAAPARLRRRRLGPRRARRIGGLRGTARFEGRLSPAQIRARENMVRAEVGYIRRWLENQRENPDEGAIFGAEFAVVMASLYEDSLRRLHGNLEALGRRAWREKGSAGRERRAELSAEIDALRAEIASWRATTSGRDA